MSQTVTIPSCMNPFEVTINNHTYSFKSGESVELPDEVAEVINHHVDSVPKPLEKEEEVPGGSSSGGGENKLAKVVDKSIEGEITAADLQGATQIGDYAFAWCKKITSITIPDSVTSISQYAMAYSSLQNVVIGSGITNMSISLFNNCQALKKIKILAITPPKIQSSTFQGTPSTCIYEVPAASVEAYKAATNWSNYANQIVASEEF